VRPTLAALSILLFLRSWNNALWPILGGTQPEARMAPVVIANMMGLGMAPWGAVIAGARLMTQPVVAAFTALQRHVISGISDGAVNRTGIRQ
jgi:lactose/L-arabinose transport system permease protein